MALRAVWSAPLLGAALLYGSVAQATDLPAACAPAARLEGDHGLIAPIRASLQARGVAEGGALACQRLEVRVMPASPGYDLFLTDADGRTDRRQIDRPETAAMVIESWLQADLSDPLLDRQSPSPAPAPPAGADPATTIAASAARAAPLPLGAVAALGSLRAESAVDRGSAVWWGASAGACFRLGPLCAGPQARLRASVGPPAQATRSLQDLRSFEGGLALEAPVALGPIRLLPGLFVGAGRLSGRWYEEVLQAPVRDRGRDRGPDRGPDRTSGRNDERGGRDQDSAAMVVEPFARVGLRAGAGLGLALPLGAGVAVELQLAVGVRPVAYVSGSRTRGLSASDLMGHAGAGFGLRYGAL